MIRIALSYERNGNVFKANMEAEDIENAFDILNIFTEELTGYLYHIRKCIIEDCAEVIV